MKKTNINYISINYNLKKKLYLLYKENKSDIVVAIPKYLIEEIKKYEDKNKDDYPYIIPRK